MSRAMAWLPLATVLFGGALAVTAWARPDGLPRLAIDRRLARELGAGANRAVDLSLSLLVVLGGVVTALG
jgi:hypothetical protein